ncbi:MAG: sigma-70 family RNA polymerase sigma factor [Acidimicrobiia bacterium]|nr:sigma-70 family RNA polymerase sigma factor [Acidimicrobiia bacterium]
MTPASGGSRRRFDDVDDPALVQCAQDGDRHALDALLRRHQSRMYGICRRMAGNDADGADATQEAMVAVVRGLHHFDGRAKFTTWLHRVTVNACLDELRRRTRRPDPGLPETEHAPPGGPPALDDTVGDRMAIDDALATLGPEYRAAVVLRDQLGLDYAEISEVLEVPVGTVKSRIARGRGALADRLGNQSARSDVEAPER